ncbi:MAG: N-acetylneuraminate synthase [Actinobacteria bacterium]|nr:N-acetylneuraminate synthase [Actinomycetota bacterium]NBY56756.1 N-acetylneuraminate synthase [Actinomycetota bacterium]
MLPIIKQVPKDVLLGKDLLVVAEIAQAHDGRVDDAHRLIDAAARAGVDAVKFQTHLAAAESTAREPWRVRFSTRDATRRDYWKRMEFSLAQWKEFRAHCQEVGVEFFSSPFSPESIDLLLEVGVRLWKVASGEVNNLQLLSLLRDTGLPVILSSGLSTMVELRSALDHLALKSQEVAVLQCATQYPTSPDRVGLNVITRLHSELGCVVGISDHSSTIFPSIAAAALGARIFETHIKDSADVSGPDSSSSLDEQQLASLVEGVHFIRAAVMNPVDKDSLSENQLSMREIFGRSLVTARDLALGHVLTAGDLAYKKPGGGLDFTWATKLIGGKVTRSLSADEAIRIEDVEVR